MLKVTACCFVLAMVAACSSAMVNDGPTPGVLTERGKTVQLMKADPPFGCKEIDSVKGADGGLIGDYDKNFTKNKAIIRNMAADIGANYVRIEAVSVKGEITGTAYYCPMERQ